MSIDYIQPTNLYSSPTDDTLFNNIRHNPLHILLHPLLSKQIDYCYSLRRRPRSHNFELTHNNDDRIDRMIFRNPRSLTNLH